jgi:hypothetical protein
MALISEWMEQCGKKVKKVKKVLDKRRHCKRCDFHYLERLPNRIAGCVKTFV